MDESFSSDSGQTSDLSGISQFYEQGPLIGEKGSQSFCPKSSGCIGFKQHFWVSVDLPRPLAQDCGPSLACSDTPKESSSEASV